MLTNRLHPTCWKRLLEWCLARRLDVSPWVTPLTKHAPVLSHSTVCLQSHRSFTVPFSSVECCFAFILFDRQACEILTYLFEINFIVFLLFRSFLFSFFGGAGEKTTTKLSFEAVRLSLTACVVVGTRVLALCGDWWKANERLAFLYYWQIVMT